MEIKISPSVMCCRVEEYKPYLELFEKVGLDSVHFDVMDGKYVKNVMLGTTIYKDIKRLSSLPVDVHIMAWAPEEFIPYYDVQPGDRISFHPETTAQPYKLLQSIKERGCRAGLFAVNHGQVGLGFILADAAVDAPGHKALGRCDAAFYHLHRLIPLSLLNLCGSPV